MSNVLFYSNYCEHSKKLIGALAKSSIKDQFKYINIDNRFKDDKGQIFIRFENGKSMALPPNIRKVPSLLLMNKSGHVLEGDDIYSYMDNMVAQKNSSQSSGVNEKGIDNLDCYSMTDFGTIVSDNFSFLDQGENEMSAKGDGGTRQMHNYASINYMSDINTPVDDYQPDKVKSNSLDELRKAREIESHIKRV